RLSRQGERAKWIQAFAVRVRAEVRLRRARQRSAWTPGVSRRTGAVVAFVKINRRNSTRRRRAFRRTIRIVSPAASLDRARHAVRRRKCAEGFANRSATARTSARRRWRTATPRRRFLHRWLFAGRDA